MSSFKKKLTFVNRLLRKAVLCVGDIDEMLDHFDDLPLNCCEFIEMEMPLANHLSEESLDKLYHLNAVNGNRTCDALFAMLTLEEQLRPGTFDHLYKEGAVTRLLTTNKGILDRGLYEERLRQQTYRDEMDLDEEHMYGRVLHYSPQKGYGFLRGEDGKDIFVSSMDIKKSRRETSMRSGAIVTYVPVSRNGRMVATNVRIVNAYPVKEILMPDGSVVDPWNIDKIGIKKTLRATTDKGENGQSEPAYDEYMYVSFRSDRRKELRFYDNCSYLPSNGKMNIQKFYKGVEQQLFQL